MAADPIQTTAFRRALWGIIGAPIGAMVVLAAAMLWQITQLITTTAWVDHTDQVIATAYAYQRETADAERASRNYLEAGDAASLAVWTRSLAGADATAAALRALIDDNAAQIARLGAIRREFDGWRDRAQRRIEARRTHAPVEPRASEDGAPFDRLRQRFAQFVDVEAALRTERLRTATNTARALRALASVLTIAVGLALAVFGRRRFVGLAGSYEAALASIARQADALRDAAAERETLFTEEMAARARAEAANRLKDEFLATVSHELRTPLTAILGWASILRSGSAPEGPRREKALETIERNARAQARLVDDLLDVSRIVAGKLRLDVRPIDPARAVEAAIDAVRPAADARGTRIQAVLDTHAGPLLGDADRLQQIVWNLVANAVKFTPKGGRVVVRLTRNDSSVEITVEDDGIGIDPAFAPTMFERFRQADASTQRTHQGLGLGLAIVRHLAELHGGTVSASSEGLGRGARFVVRLPISPVATSAEAPARSAHAPDAIGAARADLAGASLLVVDDEPDTRALLVELLEGCGATVRAVASADAALDALADHPGFDALVSDIGMPVHDGYALIARVRALPPERGGRLPAVALTAYARAEDRTRALRAGFNAHVAKPIEPGELVAVIASVAGRFPSTA